MSNLYYLSQNISFKKKFVGQYENCIRLIFFFSRFHNKNLSMVLSLASPNWKNNVWIKIASGIRERFTLHDLPSSKSKSKNVWFRSALFSISSSWKNTLQHFSPICRLMNVSSNEPEVWHLFYRQNYLIVLLVLLLDQIKKKNYTKCKSCLAICKYNIWCVMI